MTKPPKKKSGSSGKSPIPNIADRGISNDPRATSRGAVALSIGLLSNVPYSLPSASNVFGIGSEHPFANYWTCEGGLAEVISVLPDKIQADILLSRYFECVDPVYPMIHRQTFYADYEHFWQMNQQDKGDTDPSFIALIFVMLALGTQFVTSTTSNTERKQTAEFYASASNQALRIASYLSSASLRSIQAMVLIVYFLINDNHASDGWAFAGILIRQAYAMGLHRDPNIGMFRPYLCRCVLTLYSNAECHFVREATAQEGLASSSASRYVPYCLALSTTLRDTYGRFRRRLAG